MCLTGSSSRRYWTAHNICGEDPHVDDSSTINNIRQIQKNERNKTVSTASTILQMHSDSHGKNDFAPFF
jgi:hypothetical protein